MSIFVAIIALSILILVHEAGHFFTAKLSGVRINEFSIFMGPKIWSIKKGETTYTLRAIPIGGYVKMEGEEEKSDDERAYNKKSVGTRALIAVSGALMNLVFAYLLLVLFFLNSPIGTTTISSVEDGSPAQAIGLEKGDEILKYNNKKVYNDNDVMLFMYAFKNVENTIIEYKDNETGEIKSIIFKPEKRAADVNYKLGFNPYEKAGETNVIKALAPGYPASKVGLQVNDRIIKLNNKEVENLEDIKNFLKENEEKLIKVIVKRDNEIKEFMITPFREETPDYLSPGFYLEYNKSNFKGALLNAFQYTYSMSRNVYYTFAWLINGTITVKEISGPVGIVSILGNAVSDDFDLRNKILNLLNILALISINLAIFNLLPIPALDGSKLIILLVEKVRGKALPPEKEASITMIGFILLFSLLIFTLFNDIKNLFS